MVCELLREPLRRYELTALPWIKWPCLLAVMGLASASADQFPISFSTTGYFSPGTPSELTFQGIGGPLAPGFAGITSDGELALDELGTFTLTKTSGSAVTFHSDNVFTLDVKFFDPTGIIGDTLFEATMQGHVNKNNGALSLMFGPAKTFAFSNTTNSGMFTANIDDVNMELVKAGSAATSKTLTGSIDNAIDPPANGTGLTNQATEVVPEPLSIILLATVILVLSGPLRSRLVHFRGKLRPQCLPDPS